MNRIQALSRLERVSRVDPRVALADNPSLMTRDRGEHLLKRGASDFTLVLVATVRGRERVRRFLNTREKCGSGEPTASVSRRSEDHSFPGCGKLFLAAVVPPRGGQGVTGVEGQGRWEHWKQWQPSLVHFHENREWRPWEGNIGR